MDTKALLKHIGGQAAIAREFKISESAVSQWVDEDSIPAARRMYLELAYPGEHWNVYQPTLPASAEEGNKSAQQKAA